MSTRTRLASLLALVALVVAACAGDEPTTSPPSEAPTLTPVASPSPDVSPSPSVPTCATPLKVGLVADVGGIEDKGHNQAAYAGLEAAAAEAPDCFEISVIETANQADYAKNIASFADAGYDVIVGVGLLMGDALGDAAAAHPDAKFISVASVPAEGHDASWSTNGESLFYREDQAGYLAGILAASLTESDVVGAVGALLVVPSEERLVEGFVNGVKATRPEVEALYAYTTSFVEPEQGRAAVETMTTDGADVIFATNSLTGDGALVAACEPGALAIGVETDHFEVLPEAQRCLVSSVVWDVEESVRQALFRVASGEFAPGLHTDDASTGTIRLAPFRDLAERVPEETVLLLEETLAGLADGTITTGVVVNGSTD